MEDVANVIETEELTNIILVGHSYGGVAVNGVADRMADRIRHIVYLDALIPENGETVFQTLPAGAPPARRVPDLRPGEIVVTDNLGSHKGPAVRRSIEPPAPACLPPAV